MTVTEGICQLIKTGQFADKYSMDAVCQAIEEKVLSHLTIDSCAEILIRGQESGLVRLKDASLDLALAEFERFAGAEDFMLMDDRATFKQMLLGPLDSIQRRDGRSHFGWWSLRQMAHLPPLFP